MAPISAVSIPHSLLKCCDEDNEELVAAPSQWSVLFSLPSQPKTLLESIALPPPPPETQKPNLELCTEILGSENGALCPLEDCSWPAGLRVRSRRKRRNATASGVFPPPLTILGGEDRLRLSTKRENGRLLLVPFVPSLLAAERSGGCLRLRLLPSEPSSPLRHPEEEVGSDDEEEHLGVVGVGMESLVFGCNGEYRRIGRCKEEEDDVRPMGGGVGSRRNKVMLISDALWISSS